MIRIHVSARTTSALREKVVNPLAQTLCRSLASWPKIRPRRVRVISMDVTGTMVSFSGKLEDHYAEAARRCGVSGISAVSDRISGSFNDAYEETCERYPCFGGSRITAKNWWRQCVARSFELAGVQMTQGEEERVFQRVYSTFGSHAAYKAFPDAMPFLRWARRNGIACGVLSNADERYGDSILPMLGLVDGLSFLCFSKDLGFQKPDPRAFSGVMEAADPWLPRGAVEHEDVLPSDILHIGNDYRKDFEGARRSGMHAVLLDRYDESEQADEWRRRGAPVFKDLLDVVEFLGRSGTRLG